MIAPAEWVWFGQAGHFCAAHDCRFHLHTHVGGWCVSTVGDYHPPSRGPKETEPEQIGLGRLYETMVFPLDAERVNILDYREHRFDAYDTRDAANAGHLAMCLDVAANPPARMFTCAECFMRRGDCDCPDTAVAS